MGALRIVLEFWIRHGQVLATGIALVVSLAFGAVFSRVIEPQGVLLDPDGYGKLGCTWYRSGQFAYIEGEGETVGRGPGYPLLVRTVMTLTGGHGYPVNVQVAQCILHAFTVWLAFFIAQGIMDRRGAALAALLVAVHPVIVWWSARMYVETSVIACFTALSASALSLYRRPGVLCSLLFGALFGTALLVKTTFLLVGLLAPLAVRGLVGRRLRLSHLLLIYGTALALISPWIWRTWQLTGQFIFVHRLAGQAIQNGDHNVDYFRQAGLNFGLPFTLGAQDRKDLVQDLPKDLPTWEQDIRTDQIWVRSSLDRYRRDPLFLMKKVCLNALLFWLGGDTTQKTLMILCLNGPVLLLFLVACARFAIAREWRTFQGVLLLMIFSYYVPHLIIVAAVRYGVPVLPVTLLIATESLLWMLRKGKAATNIKFEI